MYAIVDIETTGGFSTGNKMIEIAIIVYDGSRIVEQFSSLINPDRSIPSFISSLTGITNDMVAGAPKFYEIAKQVYQLLEGKVFVAHNVGFDYSFVHGEFQSLGAALSMKKLCTVKLSRKIIPGLPSYSLGNLCEQLNISIENRHRALGDAKATALLFDMLLKKDTNQVIEKSLKRNRSEVKLPLHISHEVVNSLPEETGVYFFKDKKGRIIYIGKAKNIKKRVNSHFNGNAKNLVQQGFINEICEIQYELCGNELIALLLESQLIKKYWPTYNRAQKNSGHTYGIFLYEDRLGYQRLSIGKINGFGMPLVSFINLSEARQFLYHTIEEYQLCPKLCGMQKTPGACFDFSLKQCKGACAGKEGITDYNNRLSVALKSFNVESRTYTILGKGRNKEENSLVLVENGRYLGFGYITKQVKVRDFESLKQYINFYEDNPDIRKIIRSVINKDPEPKSIYFI